MEDFVGADVNQQIRIREKTLKFSSTALSALSLYLTQITKYNSNVSLQHMAH